jgi:hypothetical protein
MSCLSYLSDCQTGFSSKGENGERRERRREIIYIERGGDYIYIYIFFYLQENRMSLRQPLRYTMKK